MPPCKFVFNDEGRCGGATDSLVSGGCLISGTKVHNSVLFSDVRVHSYSQIDGAVLLPRVEVGRNVVLKNVVVDKATRIPEGMQIGVNPEEDRKRFHVSPNGITLVTSEMLGQGIHYAR